MLLNAAPRPGSQMRPITESMLGLFLRTGAASRVDRHIRERPQIYTTDQHRCRGWEGTPVPDISVEIDNIDEACQRAMAEGFRIEYGPATEAWGVRRFYVRDPFGRLVNILTHL